MPMLHLVFAFADSLECVVVFNYCSIGGDGSVALESGMKFNHLGKTVMQKFAGEKGRKREREKPSTRAARKKMATKVGYSIRYCSIMAWCDLSHLVKDDIWKRNHPGRYVACMVHLKV